MPQLLQFPAYDRPYYREFSAPQPFRTPVPAPVALHVPIEIRFGHRLRTLRKTKRYTQCELAHYLGIDRTHISNLENGKKGISLNFLHIIAEGFGMPLSELMKDL
jgi:DNA-binding XRE family transcriptional regulator